MNLTNYSIDTHALLWHFTGKQALSTKAKKIIDKIFLGSNKCYLSTIVPLEAYHHALRKPKFNFQTFIIQLKKSNILFIPLNKKVLSLCYKLPKNLEIHDRVITATALVTNSILITKDPEIRKIKEVKTVW
jgi:PIN domain nuclease of toxin-antitoxin system